MTIVSYCVSCDTGWSKFYPKGKGKRPETPKGAKDDKAAGETKNIGEALGKNGIGQAFLFAAAMTLAFSLVSMGRSDAQVQHCILTVHASDADIAVDGWWRAAATGAHAPAFDVPS